MKRFKSLATGINFIILIVLVNVLFTFTRPVQIDFTRNRIHSLSKVSRETVTKLDDIVKITMFLTADLPPQAKPVATNLKSILKDFELLNPKRLVVEFLDPNKDSEAKSKAEKYGIQPLQFSSLKADKFEIQNGYIGLVLKYEDKEEVLPVAGDVGNLEYFIISGIKRLTSKVVPKVAISEESDQGQSSIQYFRKLLERNYIVNEVNINSGDSIPTEATSLIVIGQKNKIGETGISKIESWVKSGKGLIGFVDRVGVGVNMQSQKFPNSGLEKIFEAYGIKMSDGLIRDEVAGIANFQTQSGSFVVRYPYWPEIQAGNINQKLPLMSGINSLTLAWATPLEISGKAVALFETSDKADLDTTLSNLLPTAKQTSSNDKKKFILGAINTEGVKVALIGDSDMIKDQFVTNNQQNMILALNMVDYFSQDNSLLSIRTKVLRNFPLKTTINDKTKTGVKVANGIAPVFCMVIFYGLITWQRKRGNEKWLAN